MNQSFPLDTAALLRRHGFRPRRRFGQNFLQHPSYLELIEKEARIERDDTVLEIGSGFGSLTRYLCLAAEKVVAVELDQELVAIARSYLKDCGNLQLVCGDVLALTPRQLGLPAGYILAANIPYYVTSAILRHLLESDPKPRRMILTVQKEVAQRICADPPNMSILALSVQVYGNAEVVAEIPAAAFYPVPKVDSAVVRIEIDPEPRIPALLLPVFFRLTRAGFGQKRKMLRNALAAGLNMAPATAADLLTAARIDPRRRAESVSLEEWSLLTAKEALRAH